MSILTEYRNDRIAERERTKWRADRDERIYDDTVSMWRDLRDYAGANKFVTDHVADPSELCAQLLAIIARNSAQTPGELRTHIDHLLTVIAIDRESNRSYEP